MSDRDTVTKAAAVLDEVIPGWYNRIDLDRLEMGDCELCILGQTFGHKAEWAIAKEAYPEEWASARLSVGRRYYNQRYADREGTDIETLVKDDPFEYLDGYSVGLEFFKLRGGVDSDLGVACSGGIGNCVWAEAIAERRANESNEGNEPNEPEPITEVTE